MIEINTDRLKLKPYAHQLRGIKRLIRKPIYGLFWEMRIGKSKCIADTASILRENGELDALVILCPAQVKSVWMHEKIGELVKHMYVPFRSWSFDAKRHDMMDLLAQANPDLTVITVSHEFLRQEDRTGAFHYSKALAEAVAGKKTWLVMDEASAFASYKSQQTRSALALRDTMKPSRVTTLDGTPIGNSLMEQFSKFGVLDQKILNYKSFFQFRAIHGVVQKSPFTKMGKLVGFKRQELIDEKVKDWCEYLEQRDCLDMPTIVTSFITVALSPRTWATYCQLRDELVADLSDGRTASVGHAAVKVLRLAQICSGFIGGVENAQTGQFEVQELSDESCKSAVEWLGLRLRENPNFRCVLWCRWRPELERLFRAVKDKHGIATGLWYGSSKQYNDELHPDSELTGAYCLIAQPQAVRYGVNFSKADTELYVSQDYNVTTRSQSEQRLQPGEGVRQITSAVDLLVTGPKGQRTVTWDISESLKNKSEIGHRTASEWKRILTEE